LGGLSERSFVRRDMTASDVTNASFSLSAKLSVLSFCAAWTTPLFPVLRGVADKSTKTFVMIFAHGGTKTTFSRHAEANDVVFSANTLRPYDRATESSPPSSTSSPPTVAPTIPPQRATSTLVFYHMILMLLAYGLIFPAGAIVALNRKEGWFWYHKILQRVGVAVAVLGFFLALGYVGTVGGGSHFRVPHGSLGLALTIVLLVQYTVSENQCRPNADSVSARFRWFATHRLLAVFILVVGLVNLVLGPANYYSSDDIVSIAIYISVAFSACAVGFTVFKRFHFGLKLGEFALMSSIPGRAAGANASPATTVQRHASSFSGHPDDDGVVLT
jgi:hypothetical protein